MPIKRHAQWQGTRSGARPGFARMGTAAGAGGAWRPQRLAGTAQRARSAAGVGEELKFHDIDVDETTVAVGGTIENGGTINIIPQDVTEITRIGRKCIVKSIGWRYKVLLDGTTVNAAMEDTVRLIMYQDSQCNKAPAVVLDILKTADFQSFNNLTNKGRFRILHDATLDIHTEGAFGDGTTNSSTPVGISGSFFKKCNIPLEFTAATGAIGEITSNNLGVLAISATGNADLNSKVRLRFLG